MKYRWRHAPVILLVGMITACGSGDSEIKRSAPQKPSAFVEAPDMVKEFGDKESAADAKYKGKWVEVSGIVNELDTDTSDDKRYILRIGGGADLEPATVNCSDIPKRDLSKVKAGDPVKVIGEVDDSGDLGVDLKNCYLG